MDEQEKLLLLVELPALVPMPPDHTGHVKDLLSDIMNIVNMSALPNADLRFRHFAKDNNVYEGRDVLTVFAENRYQFYQFTGETPETLIQSLNLISIQSGGHHLLSSRNRTLLFIIWVRTYPTYHMLATIFGISVSSVSAEIKNLIPIVRAKLQHFIEWPTICEWRGMAGTWKKLPLTVGAIDGTSHRIYRPETELQEEYYSGHRCFHCIHSQVVVDAHGIIRYIESGYLGHLNDAQQYGLMQQIGTDLPFPDELLILGDKIYPNRDFVMTPYTSAQLARKQPVQRRKCRKLNRYIRKYRVHMEHAIAEIKTYKSVGTLWRHPRNVLAQTVNLCAALVVRRKQLDIYYSDLNTGPYAIAYFATLTNCKENKKERRIYPY